MFSGEPNVKYSKTLLNIDLLPVFSMNFHYKASNILPYVCPTYWAQWKGSFGSDTPEPPEAWTYLNSACLCINRINRSAPGYWKASNQIGGMCVFFPIHSNDVVLWIHLFWLDPLLFHFMKLIEFFMRLSKWTNELIKKLANGSLFICASASVSVCVWPVPEHLK